MMTASELLELLKADRNAAIARERECTKNIKAFMKVGDEEMVLHWAQEYDIAWLEASELRRAIDIIEKRLA